MRAEIVLLAADGMTNLAIAERLGITRVTVAMWRRQFAAAAWTGWSTSLAQVAPRKIGDEKIAEVVTATLETMPAAATHTRSMAKATGVSISTVHRIWRAFSLQPHRRPSSGADGLGARSPLEVAASVCFPAQG